MNDATFKLVKRFMSVTAQQANDHDRAILDCLEKARNMIIEGYLSCKPSPMIAKAMEDLNKTLDHVLHINLPNV